LNPATRAGFVPFKTLFRPTTQSALIRPGEWPELSLKLRSEARDRIQSLILTGYLNTSVALRQRRESLVFGSVCQPNPPSLRHLPPAIALQKDKGGQVNPRANRRPHPRNKPVCSLTTTMHLIRQTFVFVIHLRCRWERKPDES
jgi:hypothetical protein